MNTKIPVLLGIVGVLVVGLFTVGQQQYLGAHLTPLPPLPTLGFPTPTPTPTPTPWNPFATPTPSVCLDGSLGIPDGGQCSPLSPPGTGLECCVGLECQTIGGKSFGTCKPVGTAYCPNPTPGTGGVWCIPPNNICCGDDGTSALCLPGGNTCCTDGPVGDRYYGCPFGTVCDGGNCKPAPPPTPVPMPPPPPTPEPVPPTPPRPFPPIPPTV